MTPAPAKPLQAQPVRTLREQVTALEAAIALTILRPRKKPVHALRATTRRIEAQLQILCLLEPETPALQGTAKAAGKVGKLLRAVRRAAGKVRDLDVQRDLIREALGQSAPKHSRHEAKYLRSALMTQRAEQAEALLGELKGHAAKLSPRLEKLLRHLEPASDLALASKRLERLVADWYSARTASATGSEGDLHGIRKAAKLARYMTESGAPGRVAKQYEQTQELGGTWHDALTLRQTARNHLGKHATLTRSFRSKEEAALVDYRARIDQTR